MKTTSVFRAPTRRRDVALLRHGAALIVAMATLASSLAAGSTAVSAQENWNPFAEATGFPSTPRRPRPAPAADAASTATQPYLPQMTGPPSSGVAKSTADPYGATPFPPGDLPGYGRANAPAASPPQTDPASQPAKVGPQGQREKLESADLAPIAGPPRPITSAAPGPGAGRAVTSGAAPASDARRRFDAGAVAGLTKGLAIPSRSPALATMVTRLFGADGPLGGATPEEFAVKAEVLYRAGQVEPAARAVAIADGLAQPPLLQALVARLALAAGQRERACGAVREAAKAYADLPKGMAGEILVMQGYCAAVEGTPSGAGIAAGLAREQGTVAPELLAALDAISVGETPRFKRIKGLTVLHWRLAELGKSRSKDVPLDGAEPAALAAIVASDRAAPTLKLRAAEIAARINVIDAEGLAAVYREQTIPAAGSPDRSDPALRRALMFRAAETERTPAKQTRHVRAALDDARRNGLYLQMAVALSGSVARIRPAPEIGWFTETAIEVLVAAGRFDEARSWIGFGGRDTGRAVGGPAGQSRFEHWLALIDIADAAPRQRRGESLVTLEDLALRGRFTADALHRLATVLDALDYNVPFRLWEASSRAPQPTAGYLPPTGVLNDLGAAAKSRDMVRTILLAVRALGPDGGEGAQIIALGDTIRALKRVGLESDARRLGFEALFASWPRSSPS